MTTQERKALLGKMATRIYLKHGAYYYVAPAPMPCPSDGKLKKWIHLCPESAGIKAAIIKRDALLQTEKGAGDFQHYFAEWQAEILAERAAKAPKEPAKAKTWDIGGKAIANQLRIIALAFADFDVPQVAPSDIAQFVDQWKGRRSAQAYRGYLSKFFFWCCRKGLRETNPAREIDVETPSKRDVYMTDEQFVAIANNFADSPSGNMARCYMLALYLLYQRGTEIRLLKWADIDGGSILFKPTKTERSSGAMVRVPVTDEMAGIFEQVKVLRSARSLHYVFTNTQGKPYNAKDLIKYFKQACKCAGVTGFTLKDIRSKAATDAKTAGYQESQIQVALAHTSGDTTRGYIRQQDAPVSEIELRLPKTN